MSAIRTPCEVCGVVLLTPADIVVSIAAHRESGFYEYECPQCETYQRYPTSLETIALLVGQDCMIMEDLAPLESHEPLPNTAITYNDLIDFHEFVQDDRRLNRSVKELCRAYLR